MKNLVKLLGIVVLVAAIGFSMTSCAEPGLELSGTTWEYEITKEDMIEQMKADPDYASIISGLNDTQIGALVDAALAISGQTLPIPVFQLKFTSDKDFTMSSWDTTTKKWESEGSGTYTVSGDDVTLSANGESLTGTVDGNTLTLEIEGQKAKFRKK